jgi:hypothetical protein
MSKRTRPHSPAQGTAQGPSKRMRVARRAAAAAASAAAGAAKRAEKVAAFAQDRWEYAILAAMPYYYAARDIQTIARGWLARRSAPMTTQQYVDMLAARIRNSTALREAKPGFPDVLLVTYDERWKVEPPFDCGNRGLPRDPVLYTRGTHPLQPQPAWKVLDRLFKDVRMPCALRFELNFGGIKHLSFGHGKRDVDVGCFERGLAWSRPFEINFEFPMQVVSD